METTVVNAVVSAHSAVAGMPAARTAKAALAGAAACPAGAPAAGLLVRERSAAPRAYVPVLPELAALGAFGTGIDVQGTRLPRGAAPV